MIKISDEESPAANPHVLIKNRDLGLGSRDSASGSRFRRPILELRAEIDGDGPILGGKAPKKEESLIWTAIQIEGINNLSKP